MKIKRLIAVLLAICLLPIITIPIYAANAIVTLGGNGVTEVIIDSNYEDNTIIIADGVTKVTINGKTTGKSYLSLEKIYLPNSVKTFIINNNVSLASITVPTSVETFGGKNLNLSLSNEAYFLAVNVHNFIGENWQLYSNKKLQIPPGSNLLQGYWTGASVQHIIESPEAASMAASTNTEQLKDLITSIKNINTGLSDDDITKIISKIKELFNNEGDLNNFLTQIANNVSKDVITNLVNIFNGTDVDYNLDEFFNKIAQSVVTNIQADIDDIKEALNNLWNNRVTIDEFKQLLQGQVTVDLTPTEITLHVGDTFEFTGTSTYNGTRKPSHHYDVLNTTIAEFEAWNSSNPAIKVVTDTHSTDNIKITHSRIRAKKLGITQVLFNVEQDDLNVGTKICTVNVIPKSETISPETLLIAKNNTHLLYTPNAKYVLALTKGSAIGNNNITCTTSDTSVANVTLDSTQSFITVSPKKVGSITIEVRDSNSHTDTVIVSFISPDSLQVTPVSVPTTLKVGDTFTLQAKVADPNYNYAPIEWKSSSNAVAHINATGVLQAKSKGNVVIYARVRGATTYNYTSFLTIEEEVPKATALTINTAEASIPLNGSITLQVTPNVKDTSLTYNWVSTDTNIASVDSTGIVTGKKIGTTTVCCTTQTGLQVVCTIHVVPTVTPVTGLSITPKTLKMSISETEPLRADISPKNATNVAVTWVSTDNRVADVSADGIVGGNGAGKCLIIATSLDGNIIDMCNVEVVPDIVNFSFNINDLTLAPEASYQLAPKVEPALDIDIPVNWSSSDSDIVTVSNNGTIYAKKVGTATITATPEKYTNQIATCKISVDPSVTGVFFTDADITITSGETKALKTIVSPTGVNKTLSYVSDNTSIATVDNNGNIEGKAGGSTTVTVTCEGYSAICKVTVIVPITGIELANTTLNLTVGGASQSLTATVMPTGATDVELRWNSTNPTVAVVDDFGNVSPVAAGETIVTVSDKTGAITASCTVIVRESGRNALTIEPKTNVIINNYIENK